MIRSPRRETKVSQVFIAIDPWCLGSRTDSTIESTIATSRVADHIVEHFQLPHYFPDERVPYPGYRVLQTRKENLANGVPVDASIWQQLQSV